MKKNPAAKSATAANHRNILIAQYKSEKQASIWSLDALFRLQKAGFKGAKRCRVTAVTSCPVMSGILRIAATSATSP
jgi:hypothetical protein